MFEKSEVTFCIEKFSFCIAIKSEQLRRFRPSEQAFRQNEPLDGPCNKQKNGATSAIKKSGRTYSGVV